MSSFPGEYDVLVDPQPGDYEDVVRHSAQHAGANQAILATQRRVGKQGETNPASLTGELTTHKSDISVHSSGRLLNSVALQSTLTLTSGSNTYASPIAIPELTLGVRVAARPFFIMADIPYLMNAFTTGDLMSFTVKDITTGTPQSLFPDDWPYVDPTKEYKTAHVVFGPITAPAGDRSYRLYWAHSANGRQIQLVGTAPGNLFLPPTLVKMYAIEA